jgi:Na+-translocating ferredoxin:NAD+ oxidoreductase subunit B
MSYSITDQCNGCQLCVSICPVSAVAGGKKQSHVIDPLRCIDCGACGMICKPGAVLNADGKQCSHIKKALWPKPVFDLKACTACTACAGVCPVCAIELSLQVKKNTNAYPSLVKPKQCISCGFCLEICASGAITMQEAISAAA